MPVPLGAWSAPMTNTHNLGFVPACVLMGGMQTTDFTTGLLIMLWDQIIALDSTTWTYETVANSFFPGTNHTIIFPVLPLVLSDITIDGGTMLLPAGVTVVTIPTVLTAPLSCFLFTLINDAYNNPAQRDNWIQATTNSGGLIQLLVNKHSSQQEIFWCAICKNDGTQLAANTVYQNGQFSFARDIPISGNSRVTIAHGLGVTPKACVVSGCSGQGSGTNMSAWQPVSIDATNLVIQCSDVNSILVNYLAVI